MVINSYFFYFLFPFLLFYFPFPSSFFSSVVFFFSFLELSQAVVYSCYRSYFSEVLLSIQTLFLSTNNKECILILSVYLCPMPSPWCFFFLFLVWKSDLLFSFSFTDWSLCCHAKWKEETRSTLHGTTSWLHCKGLSIIILALVTKYIFNFSRVFVQLSLP